MKLLHQKKSTPQAFTLIEMIGVLAVIAILAAMLLPKVFEAINNSRINNAAVSYNTAKSALTDHYAKYGTIRSNQGTNLVVGVAADDAQLLAFDGVLLSEGFLDKPLESKIGTAAHIEVAVGMAATQAATGINAAYDLDGGGALPLNDAGPVGAAVVQAVYTGVAETDAVELNNRLDGTALGAPALGSADIKGRVKYAAPVGGTTTVYIYVTHR